MIEQKDPDRLKFAQQNNWLLPLRGEVFDVPYPIQRGVEIQIEWEGTPIFDSMQRFFWKRYFNRYTATELQDLLVAAGSTRRKMTKTGMIDVLAPWARKLVEQATNNHNEGVPL